jgi:hypothetical protein
VQRVLYASFRDEQRPLPTPDEVDELRQFFAPHVRQLDQLLGTSFRQLWGYAEANRSAACGCSQIGLGEGLVTSPNGAPERAESGDPRTAGGKRRSCWSLDSLRR